MKTILTTMCLVCAVMNSLLCADWVRRSDTLFATAAAIAVVICITAARIAFKLRY